MNTRYIHHLELMLHQNVVAEDTVRQFDFYQGYMVMPTLGIG